MNLEDLDAYLSSEDSPEDCLLLSDLDGFLTGILCAPELIPPSEWLPIVWGSENPKVADADWHMVAIKAVFARYDAIADALNSEPPTLEPVFWQAREGHVIAMDWCEGFMQAVQLRTGKWDELLQTEQGRKWVFPVLAQLFDENGNSMIGVRQEHLDALLDKAAGQIPETVPHIFTCWKSKRVSMNA